MHLVIGNFTGNRLTDNRITSLYTSDPNSGFYAVMVVYASSFLCV